MRKTTAPLLSVLRRQILCPYSEISARSFVSGALFPPVATDLYSTVASSVAHQIRNEAVLITNRDPLLKDNSMKDTRSFFLNVLITLNSSHFLGKSLNSIGHY
ncbi:hypothetical protein J6590_015299 [Homalodisca vitripennis]|nr:hypothetical protein J6590_015299 [Homalodisca vitripennis]